MHWHRWPVAARDHSVCCTPFIRHAKGAQRPTHHPLRQDCNVPDLTIVSHALPPDVLAPAARAQFMQCACSVRALCHCARNIGGDGKCWIRGVVFDVVCVARTLARCVQGNTAGIHTLARCVQGNAAGIHTLASCVQGNAAAPTHALHTGNPCSSRERSRHTHTHRFLQGLPRVWLTNTESG